MPSTILVTGGAGYIGSHTCVELLAAGFDIVVVDNLSNSKAAVLSRVEQIAGNKLIFHEADIRDRQALDRIFRQHSIDAVIHFAGLKAVGESVAQPLRYYDNNVSGSVALCEVMAKHGVKTLVFSSSATVYGNPDSVCYREELVLSPVNPYGRTKAMVEEILRDLHRSDDAWRIALLRYFNPVGAHPSGLIGEDPNGIPNNLMPFITQVAVGQRKELAVFGNDYPTPDGTGIRDYIHVVDLALGHIAALNHLERNPGTLTVNLGTGSGYSVLEVISAFEAASGCKIPYRITDRRAGDLAEYFADPSLAHTLLGWRTERGLAEMCRDSWRWQQWAAANL